MSPFQPVHIVLRVRVSVEECRTLGHLRSGQFASVAPSLPRHVVAQNWLYLKLTRHPHLFLTCLQPNKLCGNVS